MSNPRDNRFYRERDDEHVTVRAADLLWLLENAKWPVDHERSCAMLHAPILTAECDCAMSRLAAAMKGLGDALRFGPVPETPTLRGRGG